jgi:hypothetical protein
MQQTILNLMMSNLEARDPRLAGQIRTMMNNGTDPKSVVRQIIGNQSPEQISNMMSMAKQYGVPDEILSQLQNNK